MTMIPTYTPAWTALSYKLTILPMPKAMTQLEKISERFWTPAVQPETLLSDQITTMERVFQARTGRLNLKHLGELVSAIRAQGTIEPLLLWRCGDHAILIDGHHRLEAYKQVEGERGCQIAIPVQWLTGTVEEAAVTAAKLNSRPKLGMTTQERSDHAWRMVLSDRFTVGQIVKAATVSRRNVQNMRRAMEQLSKEAEKYTTWTKARNAWRDLGGWGEEEERDDEEQQTKVYADRMAKEFSTKLAGNPSMAAKVFAIYCGRQSPEVIKEWLMLLGTTEEELEEGEEA